jgi:hypothetical protein
MGYLVNIKIAGKWMFIPLKMVLIGIDPYLNVKRQPLKKSLRSEAQSIFSIISVFQVTLAHSLSWNNGQWLPIENLVWTQRQPRAPQQRKFLVQGLCCQIYAAKCWIGKCSLSTLTNLRLKHSTCANEFCKFACARGGVPCTGWSSRPVWLFFWLNKKASMASHNGHGPTALSGFPDLPMVFAPDPQVLRFSALGPSA